MYHTLILLYVSWREPKNIHLSRDYKANAVIYRLDELTKTLIESLIIFYGIIIEANKAHRIKGMI